MARLCIGLRGKAIGALFMQIYTHPACSSMHGYFAAAYQEASRPDIVAEGLVQAEPLWGKPMAEPLRRGRIRLPKEAGTMMMRAAVA